MGDSLQSDVYWMLRNTTSSLKKNLRKKIENHGITWQQFHALYHICDDGIPSNELARDINCNASNMTGLVDRMNENGWVYRERSKEDRRVWLVKLTEEGMKLKTTLLPEHRSNIKEGMDVLTGEELTILNELLTKLVKKNKEGESS